LCEDVNSPLSLGLYLRFKYDQKSLAEFEFEPSAYTDLQQFEADYFVASYLSKYKGLVTGIDQKAVALQKFESSELLCAQTNRRIRDLRYGRLCSGPSNEFFVAKRKIAQVLGPFSVFALEAGAGWGPGATDDLRRREAALDTKIIKVPISVTKQAKHLIDKIIRSDAHWSCSILGVSPEDLSGPFSFLPIVFNIVEDNVVEFVPKNAKTHRIIAKEPRANAFLQKGYGAYFRKRLKRVGVDLDNQEENQKGASRAFFDDLSTLDLKGASDSMSVELVYELLPIDWVLALEDVRVKSSKLPDGRSVRLNKFSSMGNGFTFELESLLFWALASAVKETRGVGGRLLVYGDDIIVPRVIAEDVISLLEFAGFQVNEEKSFITGNFFESCGKHFFMGVDVTPVFQKEVPDSVEELIRAGNRLMRLSDRFSRCGRLWRPVKRAWHYLYSFAGKSSRFQIPLGTEGDDGWLVNAELFHTVPFDLNFGLRCRVFSKPVRSFPAHELAILSWYLRIKGFGSHDSNLLTLQSLGPKREMAAFQGDVSFAPVDTAPLRERRRWVMPTGDFGLSW